MEERASLLKIEYFLKKAINILEVMLWTKRFYKEGRSPSEVISMVRVYLKELCETISNLKKSRKKKNRYSCYNILIEKVIFLRNTLTDVSFIEYKNGNSKAKEDAIRELIACENLLRKLSEKAVNDT